MTNAPEGAFKIPNFIDQSELAKFGFKILKDYSLLNPFLINSSSFILSVTKESNLKSRLGI